MGYDPRDRQDHTRGTLIGLAVVSLSVVVLFGLVVLGLDADCHADIQRWLPLYPDAEVVSVEHDFFRAQAMGRTVMILRSPDDVLTTRRWYVDVWDREADIDPNRGLAIVNFQVNADPDSDGSLVILSSSCVRS